jgi:hypothetical protein
MVLASGDMITRNIYKICQPRGVARQRKDTITTLFSAQSPMVELTAQLATQAPAPQPRQGRSAKSVRNAFARWSDAKSITQHSMLTVGERPQIALAFGHHTCILADSELTLT